MAERVPARLTAAEGRKFGLTVGLAFLVFAALFYWRHKLLRAEVAGGIGGLLVLAALIAPTALGPVERAWMGLAHAISKVTTPIFMGVVYFLVMTPMGFLRRMAGSPIRPKERPASRWDAHVPPADPVAQMERQF